MYLGRILEYIKPNFDVDFYQSSLLDREEILREKERQVKYCLCLLKKAAD
jgi:hypothetical protein